MHSKYTCFVCKCTAQDIDEVTMGISHGNAWFCLKHTRNLFKSLGVQNISEYWSLLEKQSSNTN